MTSGSYRATGDRKPLLPVSRPSLPPLEEYVRLLGDIWDRRMLSNFGEYARRLEEEAQAYLSNPFVRCVVNGDIGLVLSLAALEIPEGSECLVQSFTFNSTVNAILWNRLRPAFVDIDPRTLNVDVRDLERRIGPQTRAIVVTHIFGSPLDLESVLELARSREIRVVVDAAHGYGASYQGIRIGDPRLGDFQVFSLSGTKQVTSAEGGLVAAASPELASRMEFRRAYGFQNDYISRVLGLNGKLSEIHAALACLTLGEAERVVEARNTKAARYRQGLSSVPGLEFQEHLAGCRSAYKDFAILCPDRRDALADALEREGIQTKKYFRPLHAMPLFASHRSNGDDLRDTEAVVERILCLPMFNELADSDIDRVCERVAGFYGRA